MIRFRAGNAHFMTPAPGGSSDTTQPSVVIRRWSARLLGGYGRSAPPASTAIVGPGAASAPAWAAESMPSAIPLTTVIPAAARPRPSSAGDSRP